MDLAQIRDTWLATLGRLAEFAVILGVLTWLMPCNPGMYWWKSVRAFCTDLVYWFGVPLFTRLATLGLLVLGMAWLYHGADPRLLPVKQLPLWLQGCLILLIQDVLLYWFHRGFHGHWAWKFHAVHHSPKVLDWTSTSRFHPVNQVVSASLTDAVVLLLGFAPEALTGLVAFNVAYSAFVHSNLNWTFGPLRYVMVSPVFHRWHHTTEQEDLDKNFAATFPVLDLIFGTFYMPPGKLPQHFGCGDPDMPESFVRQCFYPFRWSGISSLVSLSARTSFAVCCLALGGVGALVALGGSKGHVDGGRGQGPEQPPPAEFGLRFDLVSEAPVLAAAVSADGRFVASAGLDGSVKRWEPAARQTLLFPKHDRFAKAVAISAGGGRLVSGGQDRTVRLWDAATQQPLASRTEAIGVLGVAISADGETIASSGAEGVVRVWKATGNSAPVSIRAGESVPGVALSPEGGRVAGACVDGVVRIWDAVTGEQVRALQGPASLAYCVALSGGGRRVAAGGRDGILHVWDGETGLELFTAQAHEGGVLGVAVTPDGTRIVSGGADRVVRIWDGRTGREESAFQGHRAEVTGVAVSGDGRWAVSASLDATLKVWCLPPSPRGSPSAGGSYPGTKAPHEPRPSGSGGTAP